MPLSEMDKLALLDQGLPLPPEAYDDLSEEDRQAIAAADAAYIKDPKNSGKIGSFIRGAAEQAPGLVTGVAGYKAFRHILPKLVTGAKLFRAGSPAGWASLVAEPVVGALAGYAGQRSVDWATGGAPIYTPLYPNAKAARMQQEADMAQHERMRLAGVLGSQLVLGKPLPSKEAVRGLGKITGYAAHEGGLGLNIAEKTALAQAAVNPAIVGATAVAAPMMSGQQVNWQEAIPQIGLAALQGQSWFHNAPPKVQITREAVPTGNAYLAKARELGVPITPEMEAKAAAEQRALQIEELGKEPTTPNKTSKIKVNPEGILIPPNYEGPMADPSGYSQMQQELLSRAALQEQQVAAGQPMSPASQEITPLRTVTHKDWPPLPLDVAEAEIAKQNEAAEKAFAELVKQKTAEQQSKSGEKQKAPTEYPPLERGIIKKYQSTKPTTTAAAEDPVEATMQREESAQRWQPWIGERGATLTRQDQPIRNEAGEPVNAFMEPRTRVDAQYPIVTHRASETSTTIPHELGHGTLEDMKAGSAREQKLAQEMLDKWGGDEEGLVESAAGEAIKRDRSGGPGTVNNRLSRLQNFLGTWKRRLGYADKDLLTRTLANKVLNDPNYFERHGLPIPEGVAQAAAASGAGRKYQESDPEDVPPTFIEKHLKNAEVKSVSAPEPTQAEKVSAAVTDMTARSKQHLLTESKKLAEVVNSRGSDIHYQEIYDQALQEIASAKQETRNALPQTEALNKSVQVLQDQINALQAEIAQAEANPVRMSGLPQDVEESAARSQLKQLYPNLETAEETTQGRGKSVYRGVPREYEPHGTSEKRLEVKKLSKQLHEVQKLQQAQISDDVISPKEVQDAVDSIASRLSESLTLRRASDDPLRETSIYDLYKSRVTDRPLPGLGRRAPEAQPASSVLSPSMPTEFAKEPQKIVRGTRTKTPQMEMFPEESKPTVRTPTPDVETPIKSAAKPTGKPYWEQEPFAAPRNTPQGELFHRPAVEQRGGLTPREAIEARAGKSMRRPEFVRDPEQTESPFVDKEVVPTRTRVDMYRGYANRQFEGTELPKAPYESVPIDPKTGAPIYPDRAYKGDEIKVTQATVDDLWAQHSAGKLGVTELAKLIGVRKGRINEVKKATGWITGMPAPSLKDIFPKPYREGANVKAIEPERLVQVWEFPAEGTPERKKLDNDLRGIAIRAILRSPNTGSVDEMIGFMHDMLQRNYDAEHIAKYPTPQDYAAKVARDYTQGVERSAKTSQLAEDRSTPEEGDEGAGKHYSEGEVTQPDVEPEYEPLNKGTPREWLDEIDANRAPDIMTFSGLRKHLWNLARNKETNRTVLTSGDIVNWLEANYPEEFRTKDPETGQPIPFSDYINKINKSRLKPEEPKEAPVKSAFERDALKVPKSAKTQRSGLTPDEISLDNPESEYPKTKPPAPTADTPVSIPVGRSHLDKLRRQGPQGKILADAAHRNLIQAEEGTAYYNKAQMAAKKFSTQELNTVYNTLLAEDRSRRTFRHTLPDNLLPLYDTWKDLYYQMGKNRLDAKQPVIGPDGKLRQRELLKTAFFNMTRPDVITELTTNPDSVKSQQLREDFVEHVAKMMQLRHGTSLVEGRRIGQERLNDYEDALRNTTRDSAAAFSANRKVEGLGLPDSWIDPDPLNAWKRYTTRWARDAAYYDQIESNPDVMRALGEKRDLYGREIKFTPEQLKRQALGGEDVQFLKDYLQGKSSRRSSGTEGFINFFNSMLTPGFSSGVRDVITTIHKQLGMAKGNVLELGKAYTRAISDIAESMTSGTPTGVYKNALDTGFGRLNRTLFEDAELTTGKWGDRWTKYANIVRRGNLKEATELLSRTLAQSYGEVQALQHKTAALGGDANAEATLNKLYAGDGWKTASIEHIGSRFGELVQGTYDLRELPRWAFDSSFAPFIKMSRWDIGQGNNFVKYFFDPIAKDPGNIDNWSKMITAVLGSALGGLVIAEFNEQMSGRKQNVPTWKEVEEAKTRQTQAGALKVLNAAALSGTFGAYGNLAAMTAHALAGNSVMGYGFPAADAAAAMSHDTASFVAAMLSDPSVENFSELVLPYTISMGKRVVGGGGMLEGVFAQLNPTGRKARDIEVANENRDMRMYDMTQRDTVQNARATYTPDYQKLPERWFKRSKELDIEQAGDIADRVARRSGGDPIKLMKELDSVGNIQVRSMPSPNSDPIEFRNYYNWLAKTQGEEAAHERMVEYFKQQGVNQAKKAAVATQLPRSFLQYQNR